MEPQKLLLTQQQNNESPESKDEGQKLSDYKIVGELGRGAYGVIRKVISLKDQKEYVMKKITLSHASAHKQQTILKEAEILKQLDHPHIIKYYTSFIENSYFYIIMEYAEGGDLSRLIKSYKSSKKSFDEKQIWAFAKELCHAIEYLHKNNILHRDIKASNIFLTHDNHIKVGDLGVSKVVTDTLPLQGTKIGTPLYLAPEMIQEKPYNFKVDIWALGCVLYNLANLDPPFRGENLITLGHNILYTDPKPLSENYSSSLNNFIMLLLRKDPTTRPQAAEIWQNFGEMTENNTIVSIDNETKINKPSQTLSPNKSNKTAFVLPNGNKLPCNQILIQKIDALRYNSPLKIKDDKRSQDSISQSRQQSSRPVSLSPPRNNIGTRRELYEKIVEKRKNSEEKAMFTPGKNDEAPKPNQILVNELKNISLSEYSEKPSAKNIVQEPLINIIELRRGDENQDNEEKVEKFKDGLPGVNSEIKELSIETKQEIQNVTDLEKKENIKGSDIENKIFSKNRETYKSNYAKWMTKILQLEKNKETRKLSLSKQSHPRF